MRKIHPADMDLVLTQLAKQLRAVAEHLGVRVTSEHGEEIIPAHAIVERAAEIFREAKELERGRRLKLVDPVPA